MAEQSSAAPPLASSTDEPEPANAGNVHNDSTRQGEGLSAGAKANSMQHQLQKVSTARDLLQLNPSDRLLSVIKLEQAHPLRAALELLPKLFAGGVLPSLAGGVMFWVYSKSRDMAFSPFGVDQASAEPITMFQFPQKSGLGAYLQWAWVEDLVAYLYFPSIFSLYANFNRRQTLGMVAVTMAGYALGLLVRQLLNKSVMWVILPFSAPAVALQVLAPGSGMASLTIYQSCSLLFGVLLLAGYQAVRTPTETWRFFLAVVVFPLFREVVYSLTRRSAKIMVLHPAVGKQMVNRMAVWGIFLWPCTVGALVRRLRFQNFQDESTLYLAVALQAVFELVQRFTLEKRDLFFGRMMDRAKVAISQCFTLAAQIHPAPPSQTSLGPHKPVVVPKSHGFSERQLTINFNSGREETVVSDAASIRASRRAVYSMFILGEVISEHVAILSVPVIYGMLENMKLSDIQLEQFQMMEGPFTEPFPMRRLISSTVLQVLVQVLVDAIAFAWEISHGFPILAVWRGRPPWAWSCILVFSTFLSSSMLRTLLVENGNVYEPCMGRDVCWCFVNSTDNGTEADSGSFPISMVRSYCTFVYNGTAGVPR